MLTVIDLGRFHAHWKPLCIFPTIEEDMLLYLAVLGGRAYSGNYDFQCGSLHSTKDISATFLKRRGFNAEERSTAEKPEINTFENMVARAILCASRRNGVQGVAFDEFFAGFLGEFQGKFNNVAMTLGNSHERITVTGLLDGYAGLAKLLAATIPFLAPPNATWPHFIRDTRAHGCSFGHLSRATDKDRHDVYIQDMESTSGPPLLICECKHWSKSMTFGMMSGVVNGLESAWKESGCWR